MFSRWVIAVRLFLRWSLLGLCLFTRGWGQALVVDLPTLGVIGYYAQSGQVRAVTVAGPGQGYTAGTRIEVINPSGPYYSMGKEWGLNVGVTAGDWCELSFWGRSEQEIPGKIRFKLQSKNSVGADFVEQLFELDSVWRRFELRFIAPRTLTTADGQWVLFLGDKAQVVDLAGIQLRASPPPSRIAGDLLPQMIPSESHGGRLIKTLLNTGPGGTEAARWETVSVPDNVWEAQLVVPWTQKVLAGDRMAGSCWVRLPPGGGGEAGVQFQFQRRNWRGVQDPWKTHAALSIAVDRQEWSKVSFQWVVPEDMAYQSGFEAQVAVNLGFGPQRVELAGLVVSNLGKHSGNGVADDFANYAGREQTAAWRTAALADIERYRKTEYGVQVRTASGMSAGATKVRARLATHEFGFGAAVKAEQLASSNSTLRDRMRGLVTNWVNLAVFENDLKWGEWENPTKQSRTIESLRWLRQQGIRVRGHTLVWPIDSSPAEASVSTSALASALKSRVSAVAGHDRLKGQIADWDVVNEPTRYPSLVDRYEGSSGLYDAGQLIPFIADCFARVRSLDPAVRRMINEFGVLEFGGGNPARDVRLRSHLTELRAIDASLVQAIGLQAHLGTGGLIEPARLRRKLDDYEAAFGLPIVITELDVNVPDEALRADYLRDFMLAAFSHRAVTDVLLWAWFDGSGLEYAGMFDTNNQLRRHALAWSNLVHREWVTETSVDLNSQGRGVIRGFRGVYDLEALAPDGRMIGKGRVAATNGVLELVVPDPVVPSQSEAVSMIRTPNGWQITFRVSAGGRFALQSNPDLTLPDWIQVETRSVASAAEIRFDIPDSAGKARFLRLAWLNP